MGGTIDCILEFLRIKSNIDSVKTDSWLFRCAKWANSDALALTTFKNTFHPIDNSVRSLRNRWSNWMQRVFYMLSIFSQNWKNMDNLRYLFFLILLSGHMAQFPLNALTKQFLFRWAILPRWPLVYLSYYPTYKNDRFVFWPTICDKGITKTISGEYHDSVRCLFVCYVFWFLHIIPFHTTRKLLKRIM